MIQSIDKTIYSCPLFEAPTKNGHCIRPYTLLMHGNSPRLFKVMLRNRHLRMVRTLVGPLWSITDTPIIAQF